MDKANLALAQYLVEIERPVHVVCFSVDQELSRHPLVTAHHVPRPAGSYFLGGPLLDLRGRVVARRVTKQYPLATVVVNGGNCLWPGINWVHYVHHAWNGRAAGAPTWFAMKDAAESWLARKHEKLAFEKARLLITNSNLTSRHLGEHFGVDRNRTHTVYLGAESEWGIVTPEERAASRQWLGLSPSRPVATFVGALGYDHRKGFDVLLKAWRSLCGRPEWDVDLLVAGSGNALPLWQQKVAEFRLGERVRLLGFSTDVKRVLAAADLLVSPVRYEAYGLNVQEAICRGIPALVSCSAGVAERYPSGFSRMLLPNPEDAADLEGRLLSWRRDMNHWKALFDAFGEQLRLQSWHRMAQQFVALVERGADSDGSSLRCSEAITT